MKKRILKGKKGFTLIELIVVIAILAVLAMLALPTFSGLIDDSKQQVADANARTVYTAAKAYYALNPNVTYTGGKFATTDIDKVEDLLGDDYTSTISEITITSNGVITVKISENGRTGNYPPVTD